MAQSLHGALQVFASLAGIEADRLIAYAEEDTFGGFDTGWHTGSLWEVEGKFLYAVVRALGIRKVLEIGTNVGCSTTHLLAAVKANGGKVTSIDKWAGAGQDIPEDLRDAWEFIPTEAIAWTEKTRRKFELVYEDGAHSTAFTEAILRNVLKMNPKVIVSHDAEHFLVGPAITAAWMNVFGEHGFTSTRMEPSDCGVAYRLAL